MIEQMEAHIALCKCKEGRRAYGVRFERTEEGWKYTWAFPIKEAVVKREGYDETGILFGGYDGSGFGSGGDI